MGQERVLDVNGAREGLGCGWGKGSWMWLGEGRVLDMAGEREGLECEWGKGGS